MAEAKAEKPKKKGGGKLPIILVLVLALAGGGFFMMKGKGGDDKTKKKAKVEVAVEVGESGAIGEYLVNLTDPGSYLRTEISVVAAKGIDVKHGLDAHKDEFSDKIISVLQKRSLADLKSIEGRQELKYELAYELSKCMAGILEHGGKEWGKVKRKKVGAGHGDEGAASSHDEESDAPKKKKKHADDEEATDEEATDAEPAHENDFDCDTGPILKVLFKSFTTQ